MINIKKVVVLFLVMLLITGCKGNETDNIKAFKDTSDTHSTYTLTGTMNIISNEDEFTYNINVSVLNEEYYKVSLINTINNHEQVILKNDDGVYLVTPELNKSFKFMSEWPNNSSQAYLIESVLNDVSKDTESTIESIDDGYKIKAKVNYPNNKNLSYEIITLDKDYNIKNVIVYNEEDQEYLSVNITSIDYNPNLNKEDFSLDLLVKVTDEETEENNTEQEECLNSCTDTEENCKNTCKIEETGNILEDIIYPLYVPTDTYLSSKDTVSTDEGNRVILTFAGDYPFILVEEVASISDEMDIVPVNGEPLFLGSTIGALSDNSLYWTSNGVDYYLTSNTLDESEMMTIAESVQNSEYLVAGIK